MRLFYFVATLLVLSWVIAQAQNSETAHSQGRIAATILNNEGEPVRKTFVCISIRGEDSSGGYSTTHCGLVTDKNGEVEIENMQLGKLDIGAEAPFGGYWKEDLKAARLQTVTLTPEEPFGRVILRIGPRPGILNLSLRDKETGEFVWSAQIHLSVASRKLGSSGTGNFEKSESSGLRVPIRPNSDVILEVSAPGYKTWFYTDPTTPSQRTLRLESDEQRSISVELEPDPQDAAKAH